MVGIRIQEVNIPADRNNITIPLQIIIKQTEVKQMKVLHLTSGRPREIIQASKTRRIEIWWQTFL